MKKIALLLVAILLLCSVLTGCEADPAVTNSGKLVLTDIMKAVVEEGFEDSTGKYQKGINPNCQRILNHSNRMISRLEEEEGVDLNYEFVAYEMHSYTLIDECNYLVKITLKGKNGAGEYSYMDTDAYLFCVEAETYGGFDIQVHCDGLQEQLEDLL